MNSSFSGTPLDVHGIPLLGIPNLNQLIPLPANSFSAGLPPTWAQSINNASRCIGMLAEQEINGEYTQLGTAFLVAPQIILTARHVVNSFAIDELCFVTEFFKHNRLILLEDGALYNLDYVLFYVVDHNGFLDNALLFTEDEPVPNMHFFSLGFVEEEEPAYIVSQVNSGHDHCATYSISSNLKTIPGFSGAPYMDFNGRVFALHCKAMRESGIGNGERAGINCAQLAVPGSLLHNIIYKSSLIDKFLYLINNPQQANFPQMSFSNLVNDFINYLLNRNSPINPYLASDFVKYCYLALDPYNDAINQQNQCSFSCFSTTIELLQEDDESKRSFLFGATPSLKSLTANQILLRWFAKLDPKAKINDRNLEKELNSYKLLFPHFLQARGNSAFTKAKPHSAALKRMKAILSALDKWQIFIEVKLPRHRIREQWINLNTTRVSGRRTVTAIDMGHKMGVVDYWINGATKWINTERIPYKILTKPNYSTKKIQTAKIKTLNERYAKYKTPARSTYVKEVLKRKEFMKESYNYQFQWWSINQEDGRLKGQTMNYDPSRGHKWVNDRLVKK